MNRRDSSGDKPTQVARPDKQGWGLGVDPDDVDGEKATRIARNTGSGDAGNKQDAVRHDSNAAGADHDDEERTRLFKSPKQNGKIDLSEVPVGWLAIINGPGFGNALPLFYGSNSIGRGANVEVPLNFGDESISRGPHARIIYDAKGRSFYVRPGEGTGLTYIDGRPVLAPLPLTPNMQIEIGHTTLRFIQLCSPEFDWQDLPAAKDSNP